MKRFLLLSFLLLTRLASGQVSVPYGTQGYGIQYTSSSTVVAVPGAINVAAQAGSTLDVQLQNAVTIAEAGGFGGVYVPNGNYTLSSCSGWTSNASGGKNAVTVANSNISITFDPGANVPWTHQTSDGAPCQFIYASGVSNILVQGGNFTLTELDTGTPLTALVYFEQCTNCSINGQVVSSSLDRIYQIFDSNGFHFYNNYLTTVDSTAAYAGNSFIGLSTSAGSIFGNCGSVDHNVFISTGPKAMSGVILTRSGCRVNENIFDFEHYADASASGQDSIESGYDGNARPVNDWEIRGNTIYSLGAQGAVRLQLTDGKFEDNFLENGGVVVSSAGTGSVSGSSGVRIANNTLVGSSVGVSCNTNDSGWNRVAITGNQMDDGAGISVGGCTTTNTASGMDSNGALIADNFIRNPAGTGVSVYGGGTVLRNTVINPQGTGTYGFYLSALDANHSLLDVSGNVVSITLPTSNYSAGTVCSVADSATYPIATTCPGTAIPGNTLYVTGGTLDPYWTYRQIIIGGNTYHVNQFLDSAHISLRETVTIASGTSYALQGVQYGVFAYGLTTQSGAFIQNFANNFYYGPTGYNQTIQEQGTPTINHFGQNYFSPFGGTFNRSTPFDYVTDTQYAFNATQGFQIGSTAASNHVPCGNGAYYVDCYRASGSVALGTSAIYAGTCASVVGTGASGVPSGASISWAWTALPTGAWAQGLIINPLNYSGSAYFYVCNPTAGSLTPPAMTINWAVQ